METKAIALDECDIKFVGDAMSFEGYASTFNGVDSYGDTILPGAYSDTLNNRSRPVMMRWNHTGPIIGKWTEMQQDGKGLIVKGQLTPGHSVAQDVYASMKHGSVDGLSIGYRIPSGGSSKDGKIRQLKKLDLVEVSVVEQPADLGARIGQVKSAIEEAVSFKEIEALLRDAGGFSKVDAMTLVSRIKHLALGDQDAEKDQTAEIAALFQRFNT